MIMITGIVLILAAAACTGTAILLQKHGLRGGLRAALHSPKWLAGTVIGAAGFGFYALALANERITIVQPLLNLSLVMVAATEVLVLRERATAAELAGIGMFLAGIALIAVG